ncbi:MAG TPA: hypothetical protein VIV40_38225 [Kofleriaceae bacterium]
MLRNSWGWRIAMLAVLVGGACSVVENEPAPNPAASLNEQVFRCNVEPVLVRQCSYNACHGIAGAALRVYSPGKLRASPPADIDSAIAPLSDSEHHANFESAAGFAFGITAIDDNWLLRKPLPSGDGGYEHAGGAIYSGVNDPQYVVIRAWLGNAGVCK